MTNSIAILIGVIALVLVLSTIVVISRYVKCKPNEILIKYGKIGANKTDAVKSAKIVHGKGTFVIPIIQGYATMSLEPIQMNLDFKGALSAENIRVDVPTNLTVAIDTDEAMMQTAAERLLGMDQRAIEKLTSEVIYGQMRIVIAKMTIPEMNTDRDKFQKMIAENVTAELKKYGLKLMNINIVNIQDAANIIVNMGKEAAAKVDNEAQFRIAEQEKVGKSRIAQENKLKEIAVAEAEAEEKSKVAEANKNRDLNIASAERERVTGIEKAKAEKETNVAKAIAEKDAKVAEANADRDIRQANADKNAKVATNLAQQDVAKSDAELEVKRAEAKRLAGEAQVDAETKVAIKRQEQEREVEKAKAAKVEQQLQAEKVIPAEMAKKETVIKAEAEAEKLKKEADGYSAATLAKAKADAEATRLRGEAEASANKAKLLADAEGKKQSLLAEAEAYKQMLEASEQHPDLAIQFKIVEKINYTDIAKAQSAAFEKMNLGNINIYDSGDGKSAANFMKNMVQTVAPTLGAVGSIPIPGQAGNWLQAF